MDSFTGGRVAWARTSGITRQQLRGPGFDRLAHDLYVPAGRVDSLAARCTAFAQVLPAETVFCHATAARLLGLPLPAGFDPAVHVAVPAGAVVPSRPELVTHRLILPSGHVSMVGPVRVTSGARTFVDLAVPLRDPALIALGDAALHCGLTTVDELASVVEGAMRRRGVLRARRAMARLDGRAESAPESLVRVWIQDAGLPELTPQAVVYDRVGRFVARVDLLIEEYQIVVEYEGAHHRDREQYGRDLQRRNQLEALGFLVVHLDATTLTSRLVLRAVTAALRQRGWAPSHPPR